MMPNVAGVSVLDLELLNPLHKKEKKNKNQSLNQVLIIEHTRDQLPCAFRPLNFVLKWAFHTAGLENAIRNIPGIDPGILNPHGLCGGRGSLQCQM